MTSPDQWSSGRPDPGWGDLDEMAKAFANQGILGILFGGFSNVLQAIFGTVNNQYVSELPVITNHQNGILALQDAFNQLILQGNSIVYTSPNTYYPSPGIVSIDVILIGGGGGGGSGTWNLVGSQQFGGGGGGGGGEVHATIPAALLPKNPDGSFKGIPIQMWPGGDGASTDNAPGGGGGDCMFGTYLTAGGGNGGSSGGAGGVGGAGGTGMIPGGGGGQGAYIDGVTATSGGTSTSSYDLHGGGGGGGGGGGTGFGFGGQGGISPGGTTQGAAGQAPATVVATGGGGGAGAIRGTGTRGGAGAFPGGGGGAGGGALVAGDVGRGGKGGNPILFIIERMS